MAWGYRDWPKTKTVAERSADAARAVTALRKKGKTIEPVVLGGRTISATFWGKAWCENLESFSDYANRLPRGRSYVRSGSVLHLDITEGAVSALVRGSRTYEVTIEIAPVAAARWRALVAASAGQITSLVSLLQGRLSPSVMEIVTCKSRGLFPSPSEIRIGCSCPDWASMCKHVAATLYGVGARLDEKPELLFRLRRSDPAALVVAAAAGPAKATARVEGRVLDSSALGAVFGIELDGEARPPAQTSPARAEPPAKPSVDARRPSKAGARAAPRRAAARDLSESLVRVTLAELASAGVTLDALSRALDAARARRTTKRDVFEMTEAARRALLRGTRLPQR